MNTVRRKKRSGSAFISIVVFSFVLFVISAGFLLMTTSEYKLNRRSYDSTAAINLAEAGVDYAIWALNLPQSDPEHVSTWAGSSALKTKTISPFQTSAGELVGDIQMEVADSTGLYPRVAATGFVPGSAQTGNIHRAVKVKLSSRRYEPFKGVFFGSDDVHLHGSGSTDSYDHRNGAYGGSNTGSKGDIATYGTVVSSVDLTGSTIVNGDVATGPGGTVEGNGTITGEITHDKVPPSSETPIPPVTVPSSLVSLTYGVNGGFADGLLTETGSGTASIPSGDWKLKRIKLTSSAILTITGPARIYLTGYTGDSIAQTGAGSQIICNGKVEFYVDQQVTSSGQGIVNSNQNPEDCQIWGTSTCTSVKLSGGSALYAAVYAPSAVIDPSGGADCYGAFVGKEIDCNGNGVYHYDEALAAFGSSGTTAYEPSYWEET